MKPGRSAIGTARRYADGGTIPLPRPRPRDFFGSWDTNQTESLRDLVQPQSFYQNHFNDQPVPHGIGVSRFADNDPGMKNFTPEDQQISRDELLGSRLGDGSDYGAPQLPASETDEVDMQRGGTPKGDPVGQTIRKVFGGAMGLSERSLIPKPPRLNQLGRMGTSMPHQGMIHSVIPGRTDKIPMNVSGGSYILPADVVSGVGQGNSMAGANAFNKLFKMGPYGANINPVKIPNINMGHMSNIKGGALNAPRSPIKEGGTPGHGEHIPIIAAGGEYSIPPEKVLEIGGGNMKHGHDILDELVLHLRKKTVQEMRKLKGPKRN